MGHSDQTSPAALEGATNVGRPTRRMVRPLLFVGLAWAACVVMGAEPLSLSYELDQPPHQYWQRPLQDRFSKVRAALEGGQIAPDRSSEKAYLLDVLKALRISPHTQMLVFSTTSLQLSLITPSNPRAIYFNEDIYLGYVPGGKVEIVSLDPDLGGIFYIFDFPRTAAAPRVERSTRCMNCHSAADTQFVPGVLIKSVVPGPSGGSLESFRQEQTGHGIPLNERFGGWYLTGQGSLTNHWGNLIGRSSPQGLTRIPVEPGKQFAFARYPVAKSDLLAHLLLEHQAGFVNRAIEATYRTRNHLATGAGKLSAAHATDLDRVARSLTRYILFADEVALPAGGVAGDADLKADFAKDRRATSTGTSLRDFDLRTRIFKHRCSYMIYGAAFQGLPSEMKARVFQRMSQALNTTQPDAEYAYLPAVEKTAVRQILKETLQGLPPGW